MIRLVPGSKYQLKYNGQYCNIAHIEYGAPKIFRDNLKDFMWEFIGYRQDSRYDFAIFYCDGHFLTYSCKNWDFIVQDLEPEIKKYTILNTYYSVNGEAIYLVEQPYVIKKINPKDTCFPEYEKEITEEEIKWIRKCYKDNRLYKFEDVA